MCSEEKLQVKFLPPAQIVRDRSFLLPVIITNNAETSTDENLIGSIHFEAGFAFKPHQSKEIQFGHLIPGQKIVLAWILLATKEGIHPVKVHIRAANKIIIRKTARLVVRT